MICSGNAGYRYFRLTLNLPPNCGNFSVTNPGAYTLYFDGYVDNTLVDVMINGVSENLPNLPGGNFMAGGQVSLVIDGPWAPGVNYVDFLVYNGGGPYGLLMVANSTNSSNSDSDGDGISDLYDQCMCDFGNNPYGCIDPPNYYNCNIAQIRAAFLAAGCIELNSCMSSCSMYFLNPQSMTGSQAQAFAQSLGANLVSIQSLAENQCLINDLNSKNQGGVIWIGFNDENVEGVFEWYDGSPVTYTNWAPGEPNNSGGNEDCVQIYPNGSWNDLPCNVGNSKSIIEVNLCPVVDAGNNQAGCNGSSFTLNASNTLFGSQPYTYQWSNGANTQSTNVSPSNTTTYTVVSTDRYGCQVSDSLQITIYDNPTVQFTNTTVCSPNATVFTDNSLPGSGSITSWNWDFGDGNTSTQQNPSHTYSNAGNYNVSLTVTNSNGCTEDTTIAVTVYEKPDASFTFVNQCDGSALPFNSTSTINSGNITSYNWDFGNGNTATGVSTSHLYSTPGTYNVTHIVSSNNGCADTITQAITVYNNPTASFTHQNVCLGSAINFTNTSTVNAPDVISSYLWAFGDGSPTSNATNPSHTYTNPGNYNVTLIATTANNCSNVGNITVSVYDPPTVNFTFNNACENNPVSFTNTTSNPTNGNLGTFSWNFGDGSPLNTSDFNPLHTYATAGTYTVTLIANSSNLGCADTLQQTIDIYPSPNAQFNFSNECLGTPISFTDQSIGADSYNWNFGDNSTSSQQNPQHNYASSGNFVVTLTVTSANGCIDTSSQTITVYPMPNANFTAAEVCHGSTTNFTSTSSINNPGTISNYAWDFGDGSPVETGNSTTHIYTQPGLYQVSLIVVSNNNCVDTITLPVIVNPNPVVNFTVDSVAGCSPLCVTFNNMSNIASGAISNYEWNFGDGNQNFSNSPSHCYQNETLNPISFNVSLKATSDKGCEAILTKNNFITAYPLPIADFSTEPNPTDIFKPNVQFLDLSQGASSWIWNFGDNSNSPDTILQNPIHFYADTGVYIVLLQIENQYGCYDSISKTVTILPGFALYIPNSFTPNGDAYNQQFTVKGYGVKEFTMNIFNRWGELIFTTNDINNGWDGTYKGANCQQDIYIYKIEVEDLNSKKYQYRGTVNLIR